MYRIVVLFIIALFSCGGNTQKIVTPGEFLNHVVVDNLTYSKDSATIVADLYMKMKNHEQSFTNQEYFDSTVLELDTVMYDSSLNRIAVLVIAKNSTYRNPYLHSGLPYYYNASCYLGKRKIPDSVGFDLESIGPFSLNYFDDKEQIGKAIEEYYLLEFATVLDEKGNPVNKYNLNDKRFWDSPTGWERVFE